MYAAVVFLVVCYSFFEVHSAEIRKAQHLSAWDNGDKWWKIFPPTEDPIILEPLTTTEPSIWDRWDWRPTIDFPEIIFPTTEDPFILEPIVTTKKPSIWDPWNWRPTIDFPEVNWPTFSPNYDNFIKLERDHSGTYIAIFLAVVFLFSVLFGILKFMYQQNSRNSSSDISRLLDSEEVYASVPTISRNITSERLHAIVEIGYTETDSVNTSCPIDMPPRYDDVVQADLNGRKEFAQVGPPIPDTPPPSYDDNNTSRY